MRNLIQKVLVISLLVLLSGLYVTAQCPIIPPVTENFNTNGSVYFTLNSSSQSSAYYANQELILTGGGASGWTGGISTTTSTNAWVDNTLHQASAVSCTVNAGVMTHPELVLDLQQTYSYSPLYSWFRVLINGTPVADENSVINFNPGTQESDPFQTKYFDLGAYAGTTFTITLESSCKYNDASVPGFGDAALIDNLIIHEKPGTVTDLGVMAITAPVSGCGLGSNEHVQVLVKNYGTNPVGIFDVKYTIDGGPVHSVNLTVGLPAGSTYSYTFPIAENFSIHKAYNIVAWTNITGDANNTNNTSYLTVYSYGVVNTFPYLQDFDSGNGSWLAGGSNSSWDVGVPPYVYLPAYKSAGDGFYKTNLNGWYNNSEQSWVESPCFDFTTVACPEITFDIWADAETNFDGAALQYSTNGGISWTTLGSIGDPGNWYNGSASGLSWTGSTNCWNSTIGWVSANYLLNGTGGMPNVKLRFVFGSDANNNDHQGFAFDNVNIYNCSNPVGMSITWLTPVLGGCNLNNAEPVTIQLENTGTSSITGTFNVSYAIDANPPVTELVTVGNLMPAATFNHTFATLANLSAGPYTIVLSHNYTLSNNTQTFTLTNTGVSPINSFPYTENFSGTPANLGLSNGTAASPTVVAGGALVMKGLDGSTWIGGSSSTGTTSSQAWTDNASHIASATTCLVDATGLSSLEMLFSLKQEYVDGPGYTWFHVLVNGVAISDINGVTDFIPSPYGLPVWKNLRYDLSAYAGTTFELALQASNAYSGNISYIDNLILRQKLPLDASLEKIVAPVTSCDLTASDHVTVQVKNWGTSPISNFWVYYQKNSGPIMSKLYTTPAIGSMTTVNIQFNNTEDFTAGGTINAWVVLTGDGDATNDYYNGYVVNNIYDNLSSVYFTSFETEVTSTGNWLIQNANNDGNSWLWDAGHSHTGISAYAYAYAFGSGNDWLFTKCFNLTVGQTYEMNFWYATWPAWATAKNMDVYYGTGQNAASMNTLLVNLNNVVTNGNYAYAMQKFVAPATGTYYFGFKATGNLTIDAQYMMLDDVMLKRVNASDLGVTALVTPVEACLGYHSANEPVNITITNVSGDVISMGTPINVSYSVNAGPVITETITLAADFNVSSSINHTFATTANLAAAGTYIFTSNVSYAYDVAHGNDTRTDTIHTWFLPTPTFSGLASGVCLNSSVQNLTGNPSGASGSYSISPVVAGMLTDHHNGTASFNPSTANVLPYAVTYTYTDVHGCVNSTTNYTFVTDLTAYNPFLNTINTLFPETLILDAGAGYDAYLWSSGATTQTYNTPDVGTYSVTVTLHGCSASDAVVVTNTENQDIPMRTGWGMFSTYLNITGNIQTIMTADADVIANLIIVKDQLGNVFWWAIPTPINQIGNLHVGQGYQYKMSGPAVLNLTGSAVHAQSTPISLTAGYNFIGYLRRNPDAITTELAGIYSNVVIVKDEDGKVWWPFYGINQIVTMNPGKGYKIKVSTACTLYYLANTPDQIDKNAPWEETHIHFISNFNTGNDMTLCIPLNAWDKLPEIGDEIGVFSGNTLVGSGTFTSSNMAIAIFGDDAITQDNEGCPNGSVYTIKIWRQSTNTEENVNVISWTEGNQYFTTDAISVVGKLATYSNQSVMSELYQNTPNPFRDVTEISFNLPKDSHVDLIIYNVAGEQISTVISNDMKAGLHKVSVNENLASGVYYYKLITDEFTGIKSMTVTK
ncbi:MAG: T9SS type A sorting domain-containing protein [Bacteroidia bacterium]|nr:T9SS type A sorting domain-containing protein [Bacteroidia bacterium]